MQKTILFLMGPLNPAATDNNYQDSYTLLASSLIDLKYIDQAIFLYNNNKDKIRVKDNQLIIDSLTNINKYLNKKYLAVFIRGNWQEHKTLLKRLNYKLLYFYAADSQFLPTYIKEDIFDYIFIDNQQQKRIVQLKYPRAKTIIFNKSLDEQIYKAIKIKKKYDLCYIANFRPWKNHNQLFSAIRKYQSKHQCVLKIALVGKLNDNLDELKVLLNKYEIQADLFNQVKAQTVAKILNQSKFSVQCAELDANPRSLTESLACNIPVLLNKEITGGSHVINKMTGKLISLNQFQKGIEYMLDNYKSFKARQYFLHHLKTKDIAKNCFYALNNYID